MRSRGTDLKIPEVVTTLYNVVATLYSVVTIVFLDVGTFKPS